MKITADGLNYEFSPGQIARQTKEREHGADPALTDGQKLKEGRWTEFTKAYGGKLEEPAKPKREEEKDLSERISKTEVLLGAEGIISERLGALKEKTVSGVALKESDWETLKEIEEKAPELVNDVHRVRVSLASRKR